MTEANRTGDINISRIPVSGWGGLGLVAMAVVISFAQPQLRWLTVIALLGGAAIGLTLIAARNRSARHGATIGGLILMLAVVVAAFVYFR